MLLSISIKVPGSINVNHQTQTRPCCSTHTSPLTHDLMSLVVLLVLLLVVLVEAVMENTQR